MSLFSSPFRLSSFVRLFSFSSSLFSFPSPFFGPHRCLSVAVQGVRHADNCQLEPNRSQRMEGLVRPPSAARSVVGCTFSGSRLARWSLSLLLPACSARSLVNAWFEAWLVPNSGKRARLEREPGNRDAKPCSPSPSSLFLKHSGGQERWKLSFSFHERSTQLSQGTVTGRSKPVICVNYLFLFCASAQPMESTRKLCPKEEEVLALMLEKRHRLSIVRHARLRVHSRRAIERPQVATEQVSLPRDGPFRVGQRAGPNDRRPLVHTTQAGRGPSCDGPNQQMELRSI